MLFFAFLKGTLAMLAGKKEATNSLLVPSRPTAFRSIHTDQKGTQKRKKQLVYFAVIHSTPLPPIPGGQ